MTLIQSRFEPAAGAVLLSLDPLLIETDNTLLQRLESTLPGTDFLRPERKKYETCFIASVDPHQGGATLLGAHLKGP
ncbi:MAG TPA: hypothetical protein VFY25_03230 [Anaerolineales bacterium]|nr:hypothetical protein [Anaerolineales bacterium]